MPRGKVKLALIADEDKRKKSFKKRKNGLIKKMDELSILCDTEACGIIYDPFEPRQVDVYPEDKDAFLKVLNQFRTMSMTDKGNKLSNNESYVGKRIKTAQMQLNKQKMMNREIVAAIISERLGGKLSPDELSQTNVNSFNMMVDNRITKIVERINFLEGANPTVPPQPPQEGVGGSHISNDMVVDGTDVDCFVPSTENPGALDGLKTSTAWDQESLDNLVVPDWSLVPGDDLMKPFPDDPNPFWSGATSSKRS